MEPGTVGHTAAAFCSLSGCIMLVCYVCVCVVRPQSVPLGPCGVVRPPLPSPPPSRLRIYCKYTEAASVAASMRLCSTSSLYTTIRRSSRGPSSSRNDELAAPTAGPAAAAAAVEAAAAALRPDG